MADRRVDRQKAEFAKSLMAANNQITEQQAISLYNVRDAVHALLEFPMGTRIVINKSKDDSGL